MQEGTLAAGWDFFISYTQADRAWAEWIAWQLEDDGYGVLLQAWDMVPGANWTHIMHEGVQCARQTIAVLSSAYLISVPATAEWEAAWRDDPLGQLRKLLVVRVMDTDPPGLIAGIVSVDLFGVTKDVARARLRDGIRAAVSGRAKPASEPVFPPEARVVAAEPRFPGALPGIWNVPLRNPHFIGRSSELDRIHAWLTANPAVTVHALRGMGGVGKTQIAIEFAHRYAAEYDIVWWVNAEQPMAIEDQLAQLAEEMGLPPSADPESTMRDLGRALRVRSRWLLIFDNAESAPQIGDKLPGGVGHVLITTRRGGFRALGEVLDLDILDRSDAIILLCRQVPVLAEAQANLLAAKLGDLPLALDQAAAYLDQTGTPPEDYLQLLETRAADLHSRGHPAGHPGTVATVWSVSIETIQAAEPAAVQLLELCAWLGPEKIPLDLFTQHRDQLPEPLAGTATDPIAFNDAVGVLVDYSLARRTGGDLTIHRLVQDVARHRLSDEPSAETSQPPEAALALFLALYLRRAASTHGRLFIPDRGHRIPVKEIYVSPPVSQENENPSRVMDLWEFDEQISHTILLGDPGCGKSAACAALFYRHAVESQRPIPFMVRVRDFALATSSADAIIDYIEDQFTNLFQLTAPAGLVARLMREGKVLVIFDGLDELTRVALRADISVAIMQFIAEYPLARVLVTSRPTDIPSALMDTEMDAYFRLGHFVSANVHEYANKWFTAERGADRCDAERIAASFLKESSVAPDLCSNPLLLALMCSAYFEEGYYSRHQADIYEKCANVLYERWDRQRGIDSGLKRDAHLAGEIRHLAFWMFDRGPQRETDIVKEFTAYLHQVRFESEADAATAASAFVKFCLGRAHVLAGIDITATGDPLYAFTYRTIQEYFAAASLVRQGSPAEVAKALVQRVKYSRWSMLGRITVQILDRIYEDGREEVITALVAEGADLAAEDRAKLLGFVAECKTSAS